MCGPAVITAEDKDRIAAYRAVAGQVTASPFGDDDEIGMLNLITADSMRRVLSEIDAGKVFDLSTDYFIGMPNWTASGDPPYQIWMSHTPAGSVLDDPAGVGPEQNEYVGYSGDCVTMYTHCGTHVDTLAHFGYHGTIWNGFTANEHLGSRAWRKCGAEKHPPVIARGVLVDVAASKGVGVLPPGYAIGKSDICEALERQGTELRVGDVVLVRTGRMSLWPDARAFIDNEPGVDLGGARHLAEMGAAMVGADNIAFERMPTGDPDNWQVVHCFLFAEAGIPLLEMADLEELSRAGVYEFAFIGACLRLRGATGSPMRPLAFPLRSRA